MPEYIGTAGDWYLVTSTERASVEAGTTTVATIVSTKKKKKD